MGSGASKLCRTLARLERAVDLRLSELSSISERPMTEFAREDYAPVHRKARRLAQLMVLRWRLTDRLTEAMRR